MPQLLRRPEAEVDLEDIWSRIARENPGAADRFIDFVETRCPMISENPMAGRSRSELRPGLRSFPAGSYVIFYVPQEDGVEIVRVLSGARDIDALFCVLGR